MSKPPVLHRQLDRCEVCGKKIHKMKLVRTNMDFLAVGGSNYFDQSSYNSSFWTVQGDSSDVGNISIGPYADEARVVIGDDNTRAESFGSQTWTIGGAIGDYSGFFYMNSNPVNISSWTSFVVSFDFGYYQQDTTDQNAMVYSYIKDGDGTSSGVQKRFTGVSSGGRYWWAYDTASLGADFDLTTASFYVVFATYTGGEKIWVDRLQLEKNVSTPGAFIPTSGSSVDRVDTPMMTVRKVCPSCRERLLSKTERYNRQAEERTEDPVSVDFQEV